MVSTVVIVQDSVDVVDIVAIAVEAMLVAISVAVMVLVVTTTLGVIVLLG